MIIRTLQKKAQAIVFVLVIACSAAVAAQRGAAGQTPNAPAGSGTPRAGSARAVAPVDLTGYWVAVISEDWRWRMMTPRKGDYDSVPLTAEGRRVADTWDLARDEASGNACRAFGVGGIMRMPARLHVTWQDDNTLKIDIDAGTQTRLLHFDPSMRPEAERTWQGHSRATWEVRGQPLLLSGAPSQGSSRGPQAPRGGSLKVVTTNMRAGYLRKNGVPYSEDAVITEYFDRLSYPNGDVVLVVRTTVEDPKYLQPAFITSSNFKLEKDGSKFRPTPCHVDPPTR